MPPTHAPRSVERLLESAGLVALAVAAVFLLFGGLGESSLHDGDEALYATVAREMAQGGGWLTPTYWGAPFLHKPPLPYWLMAASLRLFPASPELAARLPSAIAALLVLALVYWTARRLAGFGWALLGTGVLLANHQLLFEHAARSATFDALLSLLMLAALLAGLRADRSTRAAWTFGALLGLVALVKLPMVIFPGAVVLGAQLVELRRIPGALAWRAAAGFGALALPWHVYQLAVNGRELYDRYVRYEILGRAGGTLYDLSARAFIHLDAAWQSFLPWSPLIVLALVAVAAGVKFAERERPATHADEPRWISIYALVLLGFFCLVAAKWPWYGIPAYPAAAIVLAVLLRRASRSAAAPAVPAVLAAVAALAWLFLNADPAYGPAARPSYLWPDRSSFLHWELRMPGAVAWLVLAALLAIALVPLLPSMRNRRAIVSGACAVAAALVLGPQLQALAAVPRSHRSPIARLAQQLAARGVTRVYTFGFPLEARYGNRQEPFSSFYLRGMPNVVVTHCGADLACLPQSDDAPSALVLSARTVELADFAGLLASWKSSRPTLEIWRLDPRSSDGFANLSSR